MSFFCSLVCLLRVFSSFSRYGRGTTDNKGPLLAAMLAVSQLAAQGKLGCNVRFLVEGEEENGSGGVMESVARNTAYFGPADLLLISNNYWIGEGWCMMGESCCNAWFFSFSSDRPCLTYGLRGVIYFSVSGNYREEKRKLFFPQRKRAVSGPLRSNHAGVDGGIYREPMTDLLHLLSCLTDPVTGRVCVPDFYDEVRPVTDEEVG